MSFLATVDYAVHAARGVYNSYPLSVGCGFVIHFCSKEFGKVIKWLETLEMLSTLSGDCGYVLCIV